MDKKLHRILADFLKPSSPRPVELDFAILLYFRRFVLGRTLFSFAEVCDIRNQFLPSLTGEQLSTQCHQHGQRSRLINMLASGT